MHYLYRIINQLNNKIYIGQTKHQKNRWMAHKSYAKHPERTKQYIHSAMAKYGADNFVYEIIATCQTQEDANEIESLLRKNSEYSRPGIKSVPISKLISFLKEEFSIVQQLQLK